MICYNKRLDRFGQAFLSLPCVKGGGFLRSKKTEGLLRVAKLQSPTAYGGAPFTQGGLFSKTM